MYGLRRSAIKRDPMKQIMLCLLLLPALVVSSCRTPIETPKTETAHQKREIPWKDAKHLLASAPVTRVFLAHSYGLMFELRSERYWTVVPDHVESDWLSKTMDRRRERGEQIDFMME